MKFEDLPKIDGLTVAGFYLVPPLEGEPIPYQKNYRNGVILKPVLQEDGSYLWKIHEPGMAIGACVNKQGYWEMESSANRGDKRFFKRCRFETIELALAAWRLYEKHARKIAARRAANWSAAQKTEEEEATLLIATKPEE